MANTKDILNALISVEGIGTAVCVGRDGFVIAAAAGANVDAIGAMVSTGLGSAESVGKELEAGVLTQAMMEYKNGVIVMTSIGADAILAVVAEEGEQALEMYACRLRKESATWKQFYSVVLQVN
ncbi:MAG: roadblock/LC7 domain-containing protein [Candidatus Sabulitectum sp.]|nr:roadblock/LC7 domain-containing protein [Candidatus Sabulitectum sp.]